MSIHRATETAEKYRSMAADCRRRSAESYERCDTDGFLSQWAADQSARLYDTLADLAEQGGVAEFPTLYRDGQMVPCKQMRTRYGLAWAIWGSWDDIANRGPIVEWVGLGDRAVAKKGYEVRHVKTAAVVGDAGGGLRIAYFFLPAGCGYVHPGNVVEEVTA